MANEVAVEVDAGVAVVVLQRGPNNYIDPGFVAELADVYEELDGAGNVRALVLTGAGKNFCAGMKLAGGEEPVEGVGERLYAAAARLFASTKPVIAAVNGAAIGGGLGLACSADFRVGTEQSRLAANFAMLGFHHGFALSVTLPRIIGMQRAAELLYTGRRLSGSASGQIGLLDRCVEEGKLLDGSIALAREIAVSAPLAVQSIRATLRGDLAREAAAAMVRESSEQDRLRQTADFEEGVRAMQERRVPTFLGR